MMPQLQWNIALDYHECLTYVGEYSIHRFDDTDRVIAQFFFGDDDEWLGTMSLDEAKVLCQEHFEKQCLALVQEPAWMKVDTALQPHYRFIWDGETHDVTYGKDSKYHYYLTLTTDTIEEMKAAIHKHIAEDILSKLNLLL
jgi:hypothetical protein